MTASPAGGVYVHVPFCRRICPYCEFAVRLEAPGEQERWLEAVLLEAEMRAAPVFLGADTLYLGGGTPSGMRTETLERLLSGLRERLGLDPECRVHLEANPEDLDARACEAYRRLGVHFLSVGVQSFSDEELHFLGRKHRRAQAFGALRVAAAAGFGTLSCDLIIGLPQREPRAATLRALEDLKTCADLVQHVSCYQLTVHPGTHFGRRKDAGVLKEAGEDEQALAYATLSEGLRALGFEAYEVSNFTRCTAHRSAHNQKYWAHLPYLGLGPSAHSFDGRRRWWNERSFAAWEQACRRGALPTAGEEEIGRAERALEAVMFRMRTADEWDLDAFATEYGVDLHALNRQRLESWAGDGLLLLRGRRVRVLPAGLAVADRLAAELDCGVEGA